MSDNQRKGQGTVLNKIPDAINSIGKTLIDPFLSTDETESNTQAKAPMRAELFTEHQLEAHAKKMAGRHTVVEDKNKESLLKRLSSNEELLVKAHRILTDTVKDRHRISPAGEWLMDNFYLIEEQIYTGKKHLPKGYSVGLPQLTKGSNTGLPRVYDLAVEIITHSDGHVDLRSLTKFINAYQTVAPLKMGELWAIPIMLRLALIENLRRLAKNQITEITNKKLANYWANELTDTAKKDPKDLILTIADMARSNPPMESSFVAELLRRLQENANSLHIAIIWVEQNLTGNGLSTTEIVQVENQQQAADQVSISNSIGSLRFLGMTNWQDFVEDVSIIEKMLQDDPAGVYPKMDFSTRDHYRHIIEEIAKYSSKSEEAVTEMALKLASAQEEADIKNHVGYYLIDKGCKTLEKMAEVEKPLKQQLRNFFAGIPIILYMGSIMIISLLLTLMVMNKAEAGIMPAWVVWGMSFVSFIATSQLAVSLVNWLVTILTTPSLLPKLDLSKRIPKEYSSMVVVPTLLSSGSVIQELVEALEVRYISNKKPNIYFALLTDFKDAATETTGEDNDLINLAIEKINELNDKYRQENEVPFMLFHRPRKYNPTEKVWMGYERKRGKLTELNALLRGKEKENFSVVIGDESIFSSIKYIITLDSDTQLPRDAARKMIAAMAHPLNAPVYDKTLQRVTRGYGILQPRVSNTLPEATASVYKKMHGNEPGMDPYTRAVSDVYQDLYAEGSFIGKGIYEIDAFEQAVQGQFPKNRILSHDLLEGSYARAGLLTDVQLYEEYPSAYVTDMLRRHRWIRGDWQIATWGTPMVPGVSKKLKKNPITFLSRWKIFDNIRRSLVPMALIMMLAYGWLFSHHPFLWTLLVPVIIMISPVVSFLWQMVNKPMDVSYSQHFYYCFRGLKEGLLQTLVDVVCLPFTAFSNTDAIGRTIWRVYFTKRKLLQWSPFSSNSYDEKNLKGIFKRMWFSPFLAVASIVGMIYYFPYAMIAASPILAAWLIAPFFVWYISKPGTAKEAELNEKEQLDLRMLARKIWLYFEDFVNETNNWLPPDNYQENPVAREARRTSPTNIGLSLLAGVTAHDFGYIGTPDLIARTANTLNTLQKLDKFRGHLFNWYDTESLVPLRPRYISSVDSGNLMGHLVTLKQAFISIGDEPIISEKRFNGLIDTINLANTSEKLKELSDLKEYILSNYKESLGNLWALKEFLSNVEDRVTAILLLPSWEEYTGEEENWAERLFMQVSEMQHDLNQLVGWLNMPPVPAKFETLLPEFPHPPTLTQLTRLEQVLLHKIVDCYKDDNTEEENEWLNIYRMAITSTGQRAKEIMLIVRQCIERTANLAQMDFRFLFSRSQNLLSIGFNLDENKRDNSYYDLLASEARLASYTAIAMGMIPQENWFSLGRQLTSVNSLPILLSWSGSMFEYLMPLLVMPDYDHTLLNQTHKAVVVKQIEYGRKKNVPWGISESAYNVLDVHLNWQYRAFGVPGIGFKRGLGEDLVISPYSTIMSLMVLPRPAYDNMIEMRKLGFEGKYGFYEAIDYTASRLQRKQQFQLIESYMAHHQGMSFLSLSYLLHNQPMQKRFMADVQMKTALLLLQEKVPRVTNFYSPTVHEGDVGIVIGGDSSMRIINTPNTIIPEVQLLSNGRLNVMVTNAGSGYSRWKDISLTRWRQDGTSDDWGNFCYIKDIENNEYWSVAHQPALKDAETYEAVFSQGRAEFRRKDLQLETHTEIVISPEDDIELRRVHITNRSRKKRTLQITSYAEVVLAPANADKAHPAFSNLFIETNIQENSNAIICTRRPRNAKETTPVMFHLMKIHQAKVLAIRYETDRSKFIGRGNTIHQPKVLTGGSLTNTAGAVLDPIVSIQYEIEIAPFETINADLVMGIAENINGAQFLINKYQDLNLTSRVLELAWTHSQVILRQINAREDQAQLYAKMAGSIIFPNAEMRTSPSVIMKNSRGQSGLWGSSISGDLPIVLVQIEDIENISIVKQMLQAHTYWRLKGLAVDLVIWNEDPGGYRQVLQNEIQSLINPSNTDVAKDKPGGVFLKSADQISNEDRILFETVAHIIISDKKGSLSDQVGNNKIAKTGVPYFSPEKFYPTVEDGLNPDENLVFNNGYGGFTPDGKEYIIETNDNTRTPAPWVNIVANKRIGSIISESGQMYTWALNAHSYRLTPWNNDPVSDLRGEAYYIRDEESGRFWSPTGLPATGKTLYRTRHGFGYSVFDHLEDGIDSSMTVFTHAEFAVKFCTIKLKNASSRPRRISITGYVEWVLGEHRSNNMMHVITELDIRTGALLARNAYNSEFEKWVAFFDVDDTKRTFTCDRTEFLGRNGTMASPKAMQKAKLSGKRGAALDPCTALQVMVNLEEDQEREITFRLGAGKDLDEAMRLVQMFEGNTIAKQALEEVHNYWNSTLGVLQIYTPDQATNIITNGWLTYQSLASRLWGRSGFYQSGGAFGYRDQLQDVMSLLYAQPVLARDQILLCASRQFIEGDVQHWWHPPAGRGVRTTCSDDYLWLPFVTNKYINVTGDRGILEEDVNYLEGRLLNEGEESSYDLPIKSDKYGSLYHHCVTAINHALKFGEHGLPFIGSGDWNDGMDKVGEHGKGESVWLAFFLYDILINFSSIALKKDDTDFSAKCLSEAATLKDNINKNAWDGDWYRRAYFDDGTPLGSKLNDECKIDSIAQSWSVLSGGATPERGKEAMASAYDKLVKKDAGIIQLFDPPFNNSDINPGYIQGYVPGVRENGGQYTHAAIWLIMGFAKLGQNDKTWELLQLTNPVNHGKTNELIEQYKVEPYVVAADVYAQPLHIGRGGWTWYTGSAGWMYQLITQHVIGFEKHGDTLDFFPVMPKEWKEVSIIYRFLDTNYNIKLIQKGKKNIKVDGKVKDIIKLENTGGEVKVEVEW